MNNHLIGIQISKYQKAAGVTQEELGEAVGISGQAVSRWECGGAPDITLLPAIADKLGVTIDALFGRDGSERIDMENVIGGWLCSFPKKERLNRLCRLVWSSVKYLLDEGLGIPEMGYLETCHPDMGDGLNRLMLSQIRTAGGILLDIHAEDLSFVTLWPEPQLLRGRGSGKTVGNVLRNSGRIIESIRETTDPAFYGIRTGEWRSKSL